MGLSEKEIEIYNEYFETLQNLTFNSKPLIDVLTEVADENKEYAKVIVLCIEDQLEKVSIELKLPILYLIDSIIKCEPIRQYYMHLFCKKLHWIFAKVYREGKDDVRNRLSKLRFTWNGVIPLEFLTALDNEVRRINPSWQAAPPVHINPKFVPRASCPVTSVTNTVPAENVAKSAAVINTPATEEELQEKRRELLALKQRKEELEQELKMLRPKPDVIKPTATTSDDRTERLSAIANQLFSQVEELKTCTYKPAEIQKVQESAAIIKNSIIKSLDSISKEQIPSNPKLAALAKDTSILKDLIKKLTETEKILAESKKVNQGKRKMIMDKNHNSPRTVVASPVVTSSPSTPTVTRPAFSPRGWLLKNTANNPYVYTKPALNVTAGVSVVPQNPPAFRIAPVSSQLINAAAARRVRDPRLRKIEQQESESNNNTSVVARDVKLTTQLAQTDNEKDRRNAWLTDSSKEKDISDNKIKTKPKSTPSDTAVQEKPEKPVITPADRGSNSTNERNGTSKSAKIDNVQKNHDTALPNAKAVSKKSSFSPQKSDCVSKKNDTSKKRKLQDKEKKPIAMTKEERHKKLNAFAEALCKSKDADQFIEDLSQKHPKIAQKLTKMMKGKNASKKPPVMDGELMDITDDRSDLVILSSPKQSKIEENEPVVSKVEEFNQCPVINDDLTIEHETLNLPNKEDELRIEVQKLEEEEKRLEANIEQKTAEINEKIVRKASSSMNLSEQLEAVMNASAKESTDQMAIDENVSHTTGDIDIRFTPLLRNRLDPQNMDALPVPVDAEIISTSLTNSTTTTDANPFNNPFGICETLTTKDVDYRKLFSFPLPHSLPVALDAVGDDVKKDLNFETEVEIIDIDSNSMNEKVYGKRKHDDRLDEKDKRRRTGSESSSDSDLSRKSFNSRREKQYYDTSRHSDSDIEINGKTYHPDIDEGKKKRENVQPVNWTDDERSSDLVIMSATPEVPETNIDVLKMIERDPTMTTRIDKDMREIRHYGSTAVIFMNWDDPRQISFFNGMRKIIINNKFAIHCEFNRPDVESLVFGKPHRFRLGAPTRELYVDGIGYQCDFGGPSIKIRFDGKAQNVRLDGKPPRVNISTMKRLDLVAGKIDIIINEEHTFPIYLDAKPQSIFVNGVPFVLMFIDGLKRILINDVPFCTEFGKVAQSFKFKNKVYYFRFTALPVGIIPGVINISQMVMTKLPSPPPLPPSLQYSALNPNSDDFPMLAASMTTVPTISNNPSIPCNAMNAIFPLDNDLGAVADALPSEIKPQTGLSILENVNIDELFQKLVASGIVPSSTSSSNASNSREDSKKDTDDGTIRRVDFTKPESLKQKQPGLIKKLYSGMQCGSCGLRFPTEQTLKYSQHLDWHFRQNRRGKDGARTIHSRKWYYDHSDWMKFQEMEDNTDRGQSWFESHATTEHIEESEKEVPCVSAGKNAEEIVCELCRDKFEQFYNEDIEEWQLRNAIRIDEKVYHPICFEDRKEKEEPDIEEIVDLDEPINLDETSAPEDSTITIDDTNNVELDGTVATIEESPAVFKDNIIAMEDGSVSIKEEKPDIVKTPKSTEENSTNTAQANGDGKSNDVEGTPVEEDDDSDIEEVQLIEQPIEEIIINDDINDLEPNLETLNVDDIVAAQQEIEQISMEIDDKEEPEIIDKIVDITHGPHIVSIDGNVEVGDSPQVISGPTKIKINIAKAHFEEKILSPEPEESQKPENGEENQKELSDISVQPLPPGEELIAADKKERLKDRKLTEYPPVKKGTEMSGLCSIM